MIALLVKNEFKRLFATPLAWLVLAVSQFILAWAFFSELEAYQNLQARLVASESPLGLTTLVIIPAMLNGLNIIMLVVPLISMRSFASERQQQRFDLLLASPASPGQITIAKFLAVFSLLVIIWTLLLAQISLLAFASQPDIGRILLVWLFGLLVIATFTAAGNWVSSLTTHPVIAAIATYGLLILLRISSQSDESSLLYWFSIPAHMQASASGLFDSSDLVFYVLLISLFLALNWVKVLYLKSNQERWSARIMLTLLSLCLLLSAPLLQQHRYNIDLSDDQHNTLPSAAQSFLSSLEQPISFTVYISNNRLMKKQITQLLNRFKRVKSDIVIRYVDPQQHPEASRTLGITSNGEILVRYNNRQQLVKKINAQEITATLMHLNRRDQRWILNLQGHGEFSLLDEGLYGTSTLAKNLQSRGYLVRDYNLSQFGQLPENTGLIIIGSPRSAMTPAELLRLQRYLAEGGNLLWLSDPEHFNVSQSIAQLPEVNFLPGVIVDATAAELKLSSPDNAVVNRFQKHQLIDNLAQYALFPQAAALEVQDNRNWQLETQLQTGDLSWNETGALEGNINREAIFFEQQGPLNVSLLFSRQLEQDKQKLAIFGDSDFLRNQFLGQGDNLQLTLNLFHWLSSDAQATASIEKPADQVIHLSDAFRGSYGLVFMFALPILLALAGFFIPRYRKSRQ